METNKNTPENITSFTLDVNRLLPHQADVVDRYEEEVEGTSDDKTVAYARLGEEAIESFAALGEAPYASIVENAFEYKLATFDDDLDDPLRALDSATGTTKFFYMVEELTRLGFDVHRALTPEEEAHLVQYLDDSENDRLPDEDVPERINKFVTKAVEMGIPRGRLNRIFNRSKNRYGVLIGLSQDFLDEVGEDVWPDDQGKGNNYPCRYAHLPEGLQLKYITKIVPLDDTSRNILENMKVQVEHNKKKDNSQSAVKKHTTTVKKGVEDCTNPLQ
ncbi:hypothetical protein GF369_04675 [Candidatus Peregrinibacteria bacterium]|nr:hypothetical protein [Candidatus Peregrinibacteria bacterium]